MPAANQTQPVAATPAADPTTGDGAATTRPERGEAASSPSNTSVRYSPAAVSTEARVAPTKDALAAPPRGAARPGALAATPSTSATDSTPASSTGTAAGQPLAASPAAEQASAVATAPAPTFASGAGMQDMIDSIGATIEVAARQGLTQARIALHPAELGEIRIHLTQTSDGLLARITADTPAVAQALTGARAELHHSLSSLGLSLLRLDIGSSGQSDVGGREGRFPGRSDSSSSRSSTRAEDRESRSETVPGIEGSQPPAGPARGELVDVLA